MVFKKLYWNNKFMVYEAKPNKLLEEVEKELTQRFKDRWIIMTISNLNNCPVESIKVKVYWSKKNDNRYKRSSQTS